MSVNWRIASFGLLGLTLAACGVDYDEPTAVLSPAEPGTDDTIRLQVAAFDGAEYRVRWTRDGETMEDVTYEVDGELTERGQVWEVTITPIDVESGKEYAPTVLSTTIANAYPYGIVSISPSQPQAGQDLAAVPGFTDPDGEDVTYTYAWTKNGTGAGSDAVIPGDQLVKGDEWEVTVTASDAAGSSEPVTASVTVLNTVPSVAGARIQPEQVYDDTEVSCQGINFNDVDGDPEGFKTLWLVDGFEVSTDATLTGDFFDRGQVISCQLIPTDGEGDGAPVMSEPVEVGNGTPTVDSVVIDGDTQNRNNALTFSPVGAVDADGDDIEYLVWWLVNGRGVSQEQTLSPELFQRGDKVSISVVPYDGFLEGEQVTSAEVEIQNAPPVIVESGFVASPIYTDSQLDPKVLTTDADNDPVTLSFVWTVNGSTVGDSTGALDGLVEFDRADTVGYEVVPNDGIDDGEAFTSPTETVANKPPSLPELTIEPKPTLPEEDVVCAMVEEAVDADGDTVTYTFEWEVDGTAYTGLADTTDFAGDTIPSAGTELGEQWVCTVVASDGTDDANPVEAATVVRPETVYYYAESKSDLTNAGSSCTGPDGNTGYYQYHYYYTTGMQWKFDDDYNLDADSITITWRGGQAYPSTSYRYLYINGAGGAYFNSGITKTSSCDSGKTYQVTVSGVASLWNKGKTNTVEMRMPCCNYGNNGVYYGGSVDDDPDNVEYGRLLVKTEDDD
ncbi:MAG: hypothetical protein AB8H79_17535 [Myxococcota bacterium]